MQVQRNSRVFWGIFLGCCLIFAGNERACRAQESVVQAEGIASILQVRRDIARDNALLDAQRKAVEQAVGVYLSSESLVEHYELISDRILTRSAGYISNYTVMKELVDGSEYRVVIQADIGLSDLEHDLDAIQLLISPKGNPRIMFLIQENISGVRQTGIASADMSQAETTLAQAFLDKGFEVVDSTTAARNIKRDTALKAIEGDLATAAALGQQYEADVIVTASVSATSGEKILNTSMRTHRAAITAKIIRADTAALLATAGEQAKQAHIDPLAGSVAAIENASAKLAERLIPQILEQWRKDVHVAATVQLILTNASFKEVTRFKEILTTKIRGVKEVYQRSFQAGIAKFDVEIRSTTEALAEELSANTPAGLAFEITGMTQNRIDLTIVP